MKGWTLLRRARLRIVDYKLPKPSEQTVGPFFFPHSWSIIPVIGCQSNQASHYIFVDFRSSDNTGDLPHVELQDLYKHLFRNVFSATPPSKFRRHPLHSNPSNTKGISFPSKRFLFSTKGTSWAPKNVWGICCLIMPSFLPLGVCGVWWFNCVGLIIRSLLFHSVWWRSSLIGWPKRWHLGRGDDSSGDFSPVSSYEISAGVLNGQEM